MSFKIAEVNKAAARIAAECPAARQYRTDYGFGLAVDAPDRSFNVIVFSPGRYSLDQPEIVADLDEVIARLKATAAPNA